MEDKIKKLKGEYLIIFDEELNVVSMLNFSNSLGEKGIFDVEKKLYYIEADIKLFFEIKDLLKENTVKLDKKPTEPITIKNIIKTPLPPKPLTKEEAVNKSLLGITIGVGNLNKQVNALSDGMLNEIEERAILKKQIAALNNTVLMLTMKLGGK